MQVDRVVTELKHTRNECTILANDISRLYLVYKALEYLFPVAHTLELRQASVVNFGATL